MLLFFLFFLIVPIYITYVLTVSNFWQSNYWETSKRVMEKDKNEPMTSDLWFIQQNYKYLPALLLFNYYYYELIFTDSIITEV